MKNKIRRLVLKKEEGSFLEQVICTFCIIVVILLLIFSLRIRFIEISKNTSDDSLVASLLAGAIVDIERYGTDHVLVVRDFDESFEAYKNTLSVNLGIHNDYTVDEGSSLYSSTVTLHRYIVYNVDENYVDTNGAVKCKVEVIDYNNPTEYSGGTGGSISRQTYVFDDKDSITIKAPDGMGITATTLYGEIGYDMQGYFNTDKVYVHISKAVDIVENSTIVTP